MSPLKIFLFGQFEVLQNDQGISSKLWQSRQVRGILKILVAMRGKPVTNSQIIEILWPEEDSNTAHQHLYVRISQLRKLLTIEHNNELIQKVDGGYVFAPPNNINQSIDNSLYWIDVDQFEKYADRGRVFLEEKQFKSAIQSFENARDLYRGDFLSEDIYQEWTMGERERLRDRYLILLTELAEAYAQLGYYRRAINVCRQVLTIEPCREAVYLHLMVYYYYAGEKSRALQVFDQCKQVLSVELGVEPDFFTMQMAERIRDGNLWSQKEIPSYPPPNYEGRLYEVPYSLGKVPFAGRDKEYAWLINQWHTHKQPVIWIEGEAGVGKTRLVEEFIGFINKEGSQVLKLNGSGYQSTPYAAWINGIKNHPEIFQTKDLSDHTRNIITAMTADFTPADTNNILLPNSFSTNQINNALQEILHYLLPGKGLLWIDDAHLLDKASIDLLSASIGVIPLLIVCRTEDTPPDHPIRRFSENTHSEWVSFNLKRLQLDGIRTLLSRLNTGEIQELGEKLFLITRGNPLFVIATLQHLFEQGILYINSNGNWEQSGPIEHALSPSIEQTIALRLHQIRPNDRRILDVISVAGGEINYDLLADVLKLDEAVLLENVDNLIEYGFLVEPRNFGKAEVALSHACYAEVLYNTLPKARCRIYHRRLGEAMVTANLDSPYFASVLANHFHLGEDPKNALKFTKLAGDYALRLYDPQQALSHYQNADSWLETLKIDKDTEYRAQLWMGIAEALRLTGDFDRAMIYYQKSFPDLTGPLKQAAAYQMFQLKALQGESLASYEDMTSGFEEQLALEGDSWALALFYWAHSFVSLIRGKQKETRWYNALGWRVGRRLIANGQMPAYWIKHRALTTMMRAHNQWGNYQTSIHFSQRILSLSDHTDHNEDANSIAAVMASLGESHLNLGHYQSAIESFDTCYNLAKKAGDPRLQGEALIGKGLINYELGNFTRASEFVEKVVDIAEQTNDIPRQVNARFLQARIAIIHGAASSILPILNNFLMLARFQQADPYIAKTLILLAETHFSLNQYDQTEVFAQEALEISQNCGLKRDLSAALRVCSQSALQQNNSGNGFRFAQQAVEIAQAIQAPFELGLAIRNRSFFQNQVSTSCQDCEHALNLFNSIGAVFEAGQTQSLLDNLKNG